MSISLRASFSSGVSLALLPTGFDALDSLLTDWPALAPLGDFDALPDLDESHGNGLSYRW